jgi:hypothetical protein
MLTLLGAVLGFVSSAFPEVLKYFREDKDCKQEQEIMDRQIELSKLGASHRLEEGRLNTDANERVSLYSHAKSVGVKWIDALPGSVRPVITYAFFILYALLKLAQWHAIIPSPGQMPSSKFGM